MIDPQSRERLRRIREEDVNGKPVYYVSEPYGENGEMTEIKIPAGQDYLRYARPSRWSELVEVKVDASPSFVYAGEPVEGRRIAVGRGTVLDGEPAMKVASGKLMTRGEELDGVKVPFRAEVKAGDLLNFDKPAHVVHPVTKAIQKISGIKISTGTVVLDVSESEKLGELSKKAPSPYFYPGELLVLDGSGNVKLHNDLEDRDKYLTTMLDPDEGSSYGTSRRPRKKKDDDGMEDEMGDFR